MSILVISNPVCGSGNGPQFLSEYIVPLLNGSSISIVRVVTTEAAGHAGVLVLEYMRHTNGPVTILLSSGDGTLHEIINACADAEREGFKLPKLRLALVPSGTANAFYSAHFPSSAQGTDPIAYKMQSVQSLINGSRTVLISLATTHFCAADSASPSKSIVSAVVASTALHASILHDSEELRQEIPDMSRFKKAAEKNITRWYKATASFLPAPSGEVYIYDSRSGDFVAHTESNAVTHEVEMSGPFAYFLSVVNVDRLEPLFNIAPLQSRIRPEQGTLDVVVVRPLRSGAIKGDSEDDKRAFASTSVAVLTQAYQQGRHVDLKYAEDGSAALDATGVSVVEYIRCGGWVWNPDPSDEPAHLMCADGTIVHIDQGGRALCKVELPNDGPTFSVYV